jgi:hypothetical protein
MWLTIIAPWKSSFYLQAVNRSASSDALKADKSDNDNDDDDNVASSAAAAAASSTSSSSSSSSKNQANDITFW